MLLKMLLLGNDGVMVVVPKIDGNSLSFKIE